MNVSIDIETYSDVDLKKAGVYRYAESDSFEILLFSYCLDGAMHTVDLAKGDCIPDDVLDMLDDPKVTKWAFNSQFERVCLSAYLHKCYPSKLQTTFLKPEGWKCTMTWCAYLGLPMSLEAAGAVLRLDKKKLEVGKSLITYFSKPCKATKANGGRTRNRPTDAPDRWTEYVQYNLRDVEVETSIQAKLAKYPLPDFLWEEFYLDQAINDRGIAIDSTFISKAIEFSDLEKNTLMNRLVAITGLENPNSVTQLKQWLMEQGVQVEGLDKKSVQQLIPKTSGQVQEALMLRLKLAKSSIRKYQAMENTCCRDGRVRGMFRFYGANRSGRWAGRLIQLQNLPQNHIPDLEEAKGLVSEGTYDDFARLYDVQPTLSELIRTSFIPSKGYKFIVADFSSIEARVLSYLADETWRNMLFASGGDIYCQSASQMFGVPVEKHGQNAHLRQKGKIAELACGYGGSVGALKAMGALEMGLSEEELQPLVTAWRTANEAIVRYWWDVDRAVKETIADWAPRFVGSTKFFCRSNVLFIELPSKRRLSYIKPRIELNQYGGESVTYYGLGLTKKWERIESYGPKFVENIVQGISRDILAHAMRRLQPFRICAHVHDEVIIEAPQSQSVAEICELMSQVPTWVPGLQLTADGYECSCYQKQ